MNNQPPTTSQYQLPPQTVVDIIDARPEPTVVLSPDARWMLLVERAATPNIADLARRTLPLAGIRIDSAANAEFQAGYRTGLAFRLRSGGETRWVPLPDSARISSIHWSHKSDRIAFTLVTDVGTELWTCRADDAAHPVKLTDRLSLVLDSYTWMPDGNRIQCLLVPTNRGAEPAAPQAPLGPNIQESIGNTSPVRTYQDLLGNPHDEALFEYYTTTQLALVDMQGKITNVGQPAIFARVQPSPDGEHLLLTTIEKPFSYLLPYSAFPKRIAVWNLRGQEVYRVADVPLEENIPIEGVRLGPRNVHWASSRSATLYWNEALDGGDPRKPAPHRDRLMTIDSPFTADPQELFKIEHRAMGLVFFADKNLLATREYDRDRRWGRMLLHDLGSSTATPKVLDDRSVQDLYSDPGNMVTIANEHGHRIVLQHGNTVYLDGDGASPEGLLPFLDCRNLVTLETERLWRCQPGAYETTIRVLATTDGEKPVLITRHESPTSPPNYRELDLTSGRETPLTDFADPTPQIRGIRKQVVKYERADGVPLSATLYLPENHKPGQRLPLLVWAYPREFNDAGTAGQLRTSPWAFTRIANASHLMLVTQGYAIMDNATMPVIGDPETMNDTFIEQIVSSAKAAIDKADELGVADRNRVAIGGHSYGAFMTVNLLAHSKLFCAGVARSGAYNRTLTPFGFQSSGKPSRSTRRSRRSNSPTRLKIRYC